MTDLDINHSQTFTLIISIPGDKYGALFSETESRKDGRIVWDYNWTFLQKCAIGYFVEMTALNGDFDRDLILIIKLEKYN